MGEVSEAKRNKSGLRNSIDGRTEEVGGREGNNPGQNAVSLAPKKLYFFARKHIRKGIFQYNCLFC